MTTENFFYLNLIGQIESVNFPLGPDGRGVFCRFDVVVGSDWEVVSGIRSGVTQCANVGPDFENIVFNMPIECTFKSTNIHGWPQLVLSFFGTNFFGSEVNLGYARVHVPINIHNEEGNFKQNLIAPILIPKPTSIWASMVNWITDRNPELRDPKILASGTKNKNLYTTSYGEVKLSLQCISKGAEKFSLDY